MQLHSKPRVEIKLGGHGGQGVILAGQMLGRAAALFDNLHATTTQSYGPEARGGACSSEVVISKEEVLFPYVTRPDVLLVLSQEAYERYGPGLARDGVLVVEEELVALSGREENACIFTCPATRIARELGATIAANVVLLGFFTAVIGLLSTEAMVSSMKMSVPAHAVEVNQRCFDSGYQWGAKKVKSGIADLLPGPPFKRI